jgi:hypothetical protein
MFIPAILVAVVIASVIVRAYALTPKPADLGWMSEQWLSQYRAHHSA